MGIFFGVPDYWPRLRGRTPSCEKQQNVDPGQEPIIFGPPKRSSKYDGVLGNTFMEQPFLRYPITFGTLVPRVSV